MLFQISYCLIRAFPVLLTCFLFDFSLHFATFVYTFILCVFFYLYPSFFFPRLLHIILYSYSFYFLFTELILTRFLPPKTFFPAFSLGLFLATFSFILFINSSLYVCFFYTTVFLSIFFIDSFLSNDFHPFFSFIHVTSLPVSAHFSVIVYFPFHIRLLRGSLTVSVTNVTQYSIIYPTVHIFLSAYDCPCLQTQLTSQLEGCKGGNMKNDFMRSHFVVALLSFLLNNT